MALLPPAFKFQVMAIALVILAAMVWGVAGSIQTKVVGPGILLHKSQQEYLVQGSTEGRVGTILVDIGETVDKGQILTEISQPVQDMHIRVTEQALEHIGEDLEENTSNSEAILKSREKATAALIDMISTEITLLESESTLLEQSFSPTQKKQQHADNQEDYDKRRQQILARLSELRLSSIKAEIEMEEYRVAIASDLEKLRDKYKTLDLELQELLFRYEKTRYARSPVDGIVEEILVGVGQIISHQDVIMTIANAKPGYEVISFLNIEDGHLVVKGMQAHIIPTTVTKAEYGSMRGTANFISKEPVSTARVNTLLRNQQLSERFTKDHTPYLATIELIPLETNASGFKWWSGNGPPYPISVGTLVDVEIVVREQRPITVIFPSLQEWLD